MRETAMDLDAATAAQEVAAVPAGRFAGGVARLFTGAFVAAYAIYVQEADGPMFLPTLSTTWDYRPGNFISRWAIGVGCVGLYTVQYVIFYGDEERGEGLRPRGLDLNAGLLLMAQAAVFCLSVVGAVCSAAAKPECRGNTTVHYAAAITFFALYDLYMLVLLRSERTKSAFAGAKWARRALHALSLVRALCKARFLPLDLLPPLVGDNSTLAILEWLDVAAIITWTRLYTARVGRDFKVAVHDAPPESPPLLLPQRDPQEGAAKVVWALDGNTTRDVALRYAFGTLAGCLITAIAFDTVPPSHLPFISDTFVFPPGNYISRWGGIIGCTYLELFHYVFWRGYRSHLGRRVSAALLGVSLISGFALSAVMVVSETEDKVLHFASATVFFVLYDVFLVGFVLAARLAPKPVAAPGCHWQHALCAAISVACKARFLLDASEDPLLTSIKAALEWSDALAILIFLLSAPRQYQDRLADVRFVIVETKPHSSNSSRSGSSTSST